MRRPHLSLQFAAALAVFAATLLAATLSPAAEKKLHNFGNGTDGVRPGGSLVFDAAGNLYGTTTSGGAYNYGTVFELSRTRSGGWIEKKLHNFGNGTDGTDPEGSLVFDAAGNLYGITISGGAYNYGTVFELSPAGNGAWTEKKLHNFGHGTDGTYPNPGLVLDAAGNLYGTTHTGGDYDDGMVFELVPDGSGGWAEKKLYSFGAVREDGTAPRAGLVLDAAGNLYGTTSVGGSYYCDGFGCGTVFQLTPDGNGGWTEKKLHEFGHRTDGEGPEAALIMDAAGNLYGTTATGGSYTCEFTCGTVFEVSPDGSGGWREKKLHNFNRSDGESPVAPLVMDRAGNLYGTTENGGAYGFGTAFELTPNGNGGWTERKLHNFANDGVDGFYPTAGVVLDGASHLYGTTPNGGDYGFFEGTAFEITP